MFILKNAIISITRNKGRNILIGIIILAIASFATVALAINNTASDLISSYKSAYDKELTISLDRDKMMKDMDFSDASNRESAKEKFGNIEMYTIDDVKNFAKSKHIESYYYTYSVSLNGKTIEKAENDNDSKMPNFPGKEGFGESSYDFTLNGYSSLESMSEFINGKYAMKEIKDDAWDVAFNGNYVFINEELASYNNLNLGDKIKLEDDDNNVYEFEIIGIYKEKESESSGPKSMFSNSANTIITNADSLVNIASSNENIRGSVSPTFIIDDYKNADLVKEEFYKKGLNENYTVKTNEEEATSGITSIKNVKSFSTTFLIITIIIGGTVLFVINMINIRERKYEIGVLRTIGISKIKLTMQFVSELLIVGFVSLVLGTGIGGVMSKNVSNLLLSNEIKTAQNETQKIKENFGGSTGDKFDFKQGEPSINFEKKGTPKVEAYKSIDAVVDIKVILELLAIGVSLILISSIAAMISIQRFTPLTILKERS